MSELEQQVSRAIYDALAGAFAEREEPNDDDMRSAARAAIAAMPQGEPVAWRSVVQCISDIADGRDNLDGFPRSRDEKQRRLTEIKVLCLDALKTAPSLPVSEPGCWQPIETAPKDGSHILAITMEYWKPLNGLHRWVHSRVIETYWVSTIECFAMGERKQPTHWLPLPPLPALPAPEAQP